MQIRVQANLYMNLDLFPFKRYRIAPSSFKDWPVNMSPLLTQFQVSQRSFQYFSFLILEIKLGACFLVAVLFHSATSNPLGGSSPSGITK